MEHYFRSLRSETLKHAEAAELKAELNDISAELAARPRVLCHRDFHAASASRHVSGPIGGGRDVGTSGFDAQRLPVRQYPVPGYLTNPYLGWSQPIGS